MSAVANAENNHNLDVNELVVAEAYVGKNLVMKRFHARGRGRASSIKKPFARSRSSCERVAERRRRSCRSRKGESGESSARPRRRPSNGPEGQSGRPARRHQPHLGQPLVRRPRRVRPAAARGHEDPRAHPAAAPAGRHLQGGHRAPAQEVPRHGAHGAPGRAHRQEGRRHREAAQRARQASRSPRSTSTSSRCASRKSMRRWLPRASPSSWSAASRSAAP